MPLPRLILLVLILGLWGCSGRPGTTATPGRDPVAVTVITAEKTLDASSARFSANVTAYTQLNLQFNSAGYVANIKQVPDTDGQLRWVQAGDQVRRGEELASLRKVEFRANVAKADASLGQAQAAVADAQGAIHAAQAGTAQARGSLLEAEATVRQSQAGVEEARANLAAAEAQVKEAEAQELKARLDFERARALLASQSMTRPDYDGAQANYDTSREKTREARAGVAQARSRIASGQAQLAQSRAAVLGARAQVQSSQAQEERSAAGLASAQAQVTGAQGGVEQATVELGDIQLKSPLDGVVVSRKVDVGQKVDPGTQGFEVADNRNVKVTFGVPDVQLKDLKLGQQLTIFTEALPGLTFKGRVESIGAEADAQSRVYQVKIKVPNPQGKLALGMSASLDLSTDASRSNPVKVPTVPLAAVQMDRDNPNGGGLVYVTVSKNGETLAEQRRVRTGAVVGDKLQILSGLDEGDQVIVSGANAVREGDPVKIIKE